MKRLITIIMFVFLIVSLASCSNNASVDTSEQPAVTSNPLPETETNPTATSKPTDIPPTPTSEQSEASWPDAFQFCRTNPDNLEGEADCWVLKSTEQWLDLDPRAGDELAVAFWPMNMPLPPLPEGLEWEKERRLIKEDNAGHIYFWVVVASEAQVPWPETHFFCRSIPDDPKGKSDCQKVSSVEEWLEIDIQLGDELGIWPEGMPVPPLPEGMEWKKVRDASIGESFWIVFPSE